MSAGMAYIRYQGETVPLSRKFGPKQHGHTSLGETCPACGDPFVEGDWTTLIPLGPGASPDAQELCRTGRYYNSVAVEVHWVCATGDETS